MIKTIFAVLIFFFILTVSVFGQDQNANIAVSLKNNQPSGNSYTFNAIDRLLKQNDLLNGKINEQNAKIDRLNARLENKDPKTINEVVSSFTESIILSIIAAIIFWLAFSFFPEKYRRDKIRPKLDLDIYQVYGTLFSIFDLIMRSNDHSPSTFQNKINGNKLNIEDIELGLQNKCLNETYLYDQNVSKLLITGKNIFEKANKIDEITERLFSFSNYLAAGEILLLEQIRKKLQVYDLKGFSRSAVSVIGNTQYMPVNPSLSYMKNNLFDLDQLFIQLRSIVFKNKHIDRDILLNKIQCHYYSE